MTAETLYTSLLLACVVSSIASIGSAWRGGRRIQLLARALAGATLLLALTAWIARWIEAAHLPLFGTYESALSLAVAVLAAGTLSRLLDPSRAAGVQGLAAAVAAALLAHGFFYDRAIYPLTISERSWVVDLHAIVAWAAFGALTVNAALAVLWLLRPDRPGDRWLYRTLSFGFLLHTALLISGSIYKFLLFGRVWSFDPVESLAFVAWMAYGTLLHLYLFAGWRNRRLAIGCVAVFVLLVVSYRGLVYFPAWSTYHIFDIDLRMHLMGGP